MKLTVVQVGPDEFMRFAISCENGVYYCNEQGWTPDKRKAARYASLAVARDDWKRLQAEMETGLTVLTARLVVTVKAEATLAPEQTEALSWYLSTSSGLTLDYSKPRPDWLGPMAVISSKIVWSSLKKSD